MRVKHSSYFSVSQCKPSRGRKRGICWCVDKYGVQLPGTDYSGGDIQCKDLESSNNNEWKKEGRTNPRPCPPSQSQNHNVTQGPCASLNHSCTLRPLFSSTVLLFFFISNWKKKEKKSRQKNRLTKETPVIFFFSFLLLTKHSPPTVGGKVPEDLLAPLTVCSWDTLYEAGPLAADAWKYMHSLDIFFIKKLGGGVSMQHFVKENKSNQAHPLKSE